MLNSIAPCYDKIRIFTSLALGIALLVNTMQGAAAETAMPRRALSGDDLYRVQTLSSPAVSPDGQWVAYVVTSNDREADQARSVIWMVSWDGRQQLPLTSAADGNDKPRWSPDGRYLAYLENPMGADKPQVMLMDRRGGAARQLTQNAAGVADYAWAPDGKQLVLVMEPPEDSAKPGLPAGAPTPYGKPIVITGTHFKQDEEGYLASSSRRHLFLIDAAGGQPAALTSDPQFDEDLPAWSPDGKRIAFIRTQERGSDQDGREDIDVMEVRSGGTPLTLVRPFAPNTQKLAWSPDGQRVTYLEGREPKFNAYMQDRLGVVAAAGGMHRTLTDGLDRAVVSYASLDAATVVAAIEDDASSYPVRIDLGSGQLTRIAIAPRQTISALTSAQGHTALLRSDDAEIAELYALEAGGLRRLTAHNAPWLAEVALGPVEDIQFKSRDGAEIHGLLVKPPSYVAGRRYPLLLWIHGGPNGGDEHALELDGYQFEPQIFAALGYVVLRVNYRGGSGRGFEYAKAIVGDWGHKEIEDLLAGVDYVVGRGIADKNRLAVGGWSYGGILTDYMIASDGRFKVAISGAGSGNQLSTYGSDEYVLQYNNELTPPWKNTRLWLKLSYPFFHADRIHTPTLFLGGEQDFNVPVIGGEQMYQALRTLGVPAELVIYPGEHHVFTRPSFVIDLVDRMTGWVAQHMPPSH